jgi:MFS transporter, FLVCR family, MFS-domain-containing protein 7
MYQEPVGYDATISGLLGACLLLTGLVAAIITAPLYDRVFTNHLALSIKLLVPPLGGAWLSLIWAGKIRPDLKFRAS